MVFNGEAGILPLEKFSFKWVADVSVQILSNRSELSAPPHPKRTVGSHHHPRHALRLDPAELDSGGARLSSHDLALAETLRLAAALGSLPPLVDIYGVEINGCTDQRLSDVAEAAATRLASVLAGLGR